jgi:polyhydroxybutyrate depolymerase
MRRWWTVSVVVTIIGTGCSSDSPPAADPESVATSTTSVRATTTDVPATTSVPAPTSVPATTADATTTTPTASPTAERPYEVFVPSSYTPAEPMPLVLLLHGHTANGVVQEGYFQFGPLAEERGFLYVHPDGLVGADGHTYWNATDACCGRGHGDADDVGYLMAIVDEVSTQYNVDPQRIFLAGHSNGGFMSYRMACEHAETFAAIASLAGATFGAESDCVPSEPVSVLQIHGTADPIVPFTATDFLGAAMPGAQGSVDLWAGYNGCAGEPVSVGDPVDFDVAIDGPETDVAFVSGCPADGEVALWTMNDSGHAPPFTPAFSSAVVDFLLSHPKTGG